ncbi:ATP-binding cassette domain-containing protein [Changpingibacter yushuensis]|uniref:ATP-binding cassette domain-containing protein n=1 Tax=Changpingibacter yushuensis TaxID=2758440 RepID=UPI002483DED2|nr:ATP-binding cassette domain-containing protein [Changpingibacter yushuensis]
MWAHGAGKSTLFRLISGELRRPADSVRFSRAAGLGVLPQSPAFPTNATCEQFISHVAWLHGVPRAERSAAVDAALDRVGLSERKSSTIKSLSGGMVRRLGIAQAIVHNPSVLLLDEPTVGLDPVQRLAIRSVLEDLGETHIVFVSTHLVEDVRALAQRVIVMSEGSMVFDGAVETLESLASDDMPGETALERSLAALMGAE